MSLKIRYSAKTLPSKLPRIYRFKASLDKKDWIARPRHLLALKIASEWSFRRQIGRFVSKDSLDLRIRAIYDGNARNIHCLLPIAKSTYHKNCTVNPLIQFLSSHDLPIPSANTFHNLKKTDARKPKTITNIPPGVSLEHPLTWHPTPSPPQALIFFKCGEKHNQNSWCLLSSLQGPRHKDRICTSTENHWATIDALTTATVIATPLATPPNIISKTHLSPYHTKTTKVYVLHKFDGTQAVKAKIFATILGLYMIVSTHLSLNNSSKLVYALSYHTGSAKIFAQKMNQRLFKGSCSNYCQFIQNFEAIFFCFLEKIDSWYVSINTYFRNQWINWPR